MLYHKALPHLVPQPQTQALKCLEFREQGMSKPESLTLTAQRWCPVLSGSPPLRGQSPPSCWSHPSSPRSPGSCQCSPPKSSWSSLSSRHPPETGPASLRSLSWCHPWQEYSEHSLRSPPWAQEPSSKPRLLYPLSWVRNLQRKRIKDTFTHSHEIHISYQQTSENHR